MYRRGPNYLFSKRDLYHALEAHMQKAKHKVGEISRQQFLSSSDDQILEYVLADLHVNALVLNEEDAVMRDEEIELEVQSVFKDRMVTVPGIRVVVSIPYTGDSNLWAMQPSAYSSIQPHGVVRRSRGDNDGILDIVIEQSASEPKEQIKNELDRNLKALRDYLANQKLNIDAANAKLEPLIRQAVQERREKLGKHEEIVKLLGIPLERRPGAPSLKPIVLEKRVIKPLPSAPKETIEYGITDADYEHILAIIRHEGATFETTPETYKDMGETDLRNILLAHLNGHYKGGATGESFRKEGKTDIRIEFENRAAFVAECKLWRGPKELTEAIDQLFGYLTWRDYKCALVVFNKDNAGFTQIRDKIPELVRSHKNFVREVGSRPLGEWRFILSSKEDAARHVIIEVLVFNLYHK